MSGALLQNVGPSCYGVWTVGDSMRPRYDNGELVYADPDMPISVGRDMVVYTENEDGDEIAYLLNLAEMSDETLLFRTYMAPTKLIRIEREKVVKIHTVVAVAELFGGQGPSADRLGGLAGVMT
jgi:hypothetical protein